MNDLEPRPPRLQAHLRPPPGPDEHQARLRPSHAHATAEPQQPAAGDRGACLLADLPPQRVRPVLARLRAAAGKAPAVPVPADQHDPVPGDADAGRAVTGAWWRVGRRVPRHPPVLSVAGDGELDAVLRDAHLPRLPVRRTGCPLTGGFQRASDLLNGWPPG